MSDDDNKSKTYASGLSSVLLICSIIVLANVDPQEYKMIHKESYYNYILMIPCLIAGILGSVCLSLCLVCRKGELYTIYVIIVCVGALAISYSFMGMVWYNDPKHSMLINKEFWTETAIKFNIKPEKYWAYIMSDVVIKIYSALLMVLAVLIPCIGLCAGCFAACIGKEDNSFNI